MATMRAVPNSYSTSGAVNASTYMLSPRCTMPPCRNMAVNRRQVSPVRVYSGTSPPQAISAAEGASRRDAAGDLQQPDADVDRHQHGGGDRQGCAAASAERERGSWPVLPRAGRRRVRLPGAPGPQRA